MESGCHETLFAFEVRVFGTEGCEFGYDFGCGGERLLGWLVG